jgi:hypothetical protein
MWDVTATASLKYHDVIMSVDNWSLVWERAVLPTVQKNLIILTAVKAIDRYSVEFTGASSNVGQFNGD